MSWREAVDELSHRRALAQQMGGKEKVARQHDAGKLTVRERIEGLLDQGSFREIGSLAGRADYDEAGRFRGMTPSNFVFGRGRIDERPVAVSGDDFTVRGGASDGSTQEKVRQSEQMAGELRMPLVRLLDSTGGSIRSIETLGFTYVPACPGWEHVVDNLASVPVVSLVLGSIAGISSARAVSSHLSVMVEQRSHMFIAGPPVVARAGVQTDKDRLGGASVHARSGAVDLVVDSEEAAFEQARRFLSYLPSSVHELPPRVACDDPVDRREESLLDVVPRDRRHVYKMREILDAVLDRNSFFEIAAQFGASVITGLARLDGHPVAVLASNPNMYGGTWTADAADKVTRFVDLAETFHLPVVHFVDVPGFYIGPDAEKAGTIRAGSRALAAVYQASVPWCSIIVRKAFGVAGAAHTNPTRFRYRYAWPSGDWGSIPPEGGIEAAYRQEIRDAEDPDAALREITQRLDALRSPFRTAEAFGVEEIIDPRETRPLLCEFAALAYRTLEPGPSGLRFRP